MVDLEGHEVALVDADQGGADVERAAEFAFVVDLHQRVETDGERAGMEASEFVVRQRRGDQQHAVGSHQSRVDHVEFADREVLADHRQ